MEKGVRKASNKMPFKFLRMANKIIKENYTTVSAKKKRSALNTYNIKDIKHILAYQKEYDLSNGALSIHFELNRNTIALWKNIFQPKN
jgi:hypothetical protein